MRLTNPRQAVAKNRPGRIILLIKTLAAAAVFLCACMSPLMAEPTADQTVDKEIQEEISSDLKSGNEPIDKSAVSPTAADTSDESEEPLPELVVELGIPKESQKKSPAVAKTVNEKTPVKKTTTATAKKESPPNSRSAALAREALAHRGARYIWGGTGRGGFDCSGFTQYLYAKRGIKLPHSAKMQYGLGKAVSKKDLQEGDLVFFNTRGPLTHVGMYIGDGKFIHAANPRRGVTVDLLDSPYYAKRYEGARRYTD